ncbi:MAG: hypothetical protein GC154_08485 [bacterium]|nr:hypothetical protein [bacterium]
MKRDAIAIVFVLAVIALFAHETWLQGLSPFSGDIAVQFYPWKSFTRSMLAQGTPPYWNPYTHGGAPLLANVQSAVFYPFDLLLFAFPMERFYGLSLLLHLWIAGVGAYAFARVAGATQLPAVLAGVAYGLNGFTMIHIPFGNHLTYVAAAWVPWMFWAATGYLFSDGNRLAWWLAGTAIAFLHFSSGHPQLLFYSLVFVLLYTLILQGWRMRRDGNLKLRVPAWLTIVWGLALLLGILMASYQLFSTLEYLGHANRAATLDVGAATEFSFAPHRLITLFFPEYFGTHLGGNHYDAFYFWSCAYAGVIVPFLALSLFRPGVRPVAAVPLAAMALLGLFLACGRGNPVYTLLLHLPGFGHFRAPAKFLPYYLAPVCVLASLGLERLAREAYAKYGQPKPEQAFLKLRLIGLAALSLVVFYMVPPLLAAMTDHLRSLPGDQPGGIRFYSSAVGLSLLLCALTLYLYTRKIPGKTRLAMSLAMTLLLCVDLFTYGRAYYGVTLLPPASIAHINAKPVEMKYIDTLPDRTPVDRVATLYRPGRLYSPDRSILWRIPELAGYDPMSLRSYNRLIGEMEGWKEGEYHDDIRLTVSDAPELDLMNVRFIRSETELNDPGLKPLIAADSGRLYERLSPGRSWAMISPRNSNGNPAENAVWTPVKTSVTEYEPLRLSFEASVDAPVWLRVAEWAFPHWTARVSRIGAPPKPVRIAETAEGLRAIALEPGGWTVEMAYREPWGRWLLTALAWIAFAKLTVLCYLLRTGRFWPLAQRAMGWHY